MLPESSLRERDGVSFAYALAPDGITVTATHDDDRATGTLLWAFGAGAQGITPVGRRDGAYFEHRLSFYTAPGRLALTFGHPAARPPSARAALGVPQLPAMINRCFNCHATNVRSGEAAPDLSHFEPGVACERCHGPGHAHAAAARAGLPRGEIARALLNPGRFPPKSLILICAECHRSPEPGEPSPMPELEDPVSVRFQPVGLLASRCFLAGGKISCLTCHDPHEDAHGDSAFYAAKCLACHAAPPVVRSRCRRASNRDCLPCHMRRAALTPYLTFTDHRIRVY